MHVFYFCERGERVNDFDSGFCQLDEVHESQKIY